MLGKRMEAVMAGFGGQGVMVMGQILAYSAMRAGLEVTWMPSYGPEQRGGTANCTVVVSTGDIASPIVARPHVAAVSYTHLRAHETKANLVCRLLLEKKKKK